MSAKSSRPAPKKTTPPRLLPEIQQEYQKTSFDAGQTQYQIAVLKRELESINDILLDLNKEAAARSELDKAAAKESSNETK